MAYYGPRGTLSDCWNRPIQEKTSEGWPLRPMGQGDEQADSEISLFRTGTSLIGLTGGRCRGWARMLDHWSFQDVLIKIVSMQQMVHPVFVAACRLMPADVLSMIVRFLARCQTDKCKETLDVLSPQPGPVRGRKRRASRRRGVQTSIEDSLWRPRPPAAASPVRGTSTGDEKSCGMPVMTS